MENPIETQKTLSIPNTQKRPVVLMVISFVAFLIIGYVYYVNKNNNITYKPEINTNSINTYSDKVNDLLINYNSDWKSVTPNPNKNESIALELKHSSGCTLRLGILDPDSLLFHQQNSNETFKIEAPVRDVYISNKHFSMTNLIRIQNSAGYPTQTFAIYINNFPDLKEEYTLAVTNNNNPLGQDCIDSFMNLLKDNVQLGNGLYTLNESSNGIIQFKVSHYSGGREIEWDKTRMALVFKPNLNSDVSEEHVITYLDLYSSDPKVQLVNNLLYFVDSRGQIGVLDLTSKIINKLSIPAIKTVPRYSPQLVNDIFINKDTLYYLLGINCLTYRAKCNLELHAFDLNTKQDTLLANGITSREIMGVDYESNKLYLNYVDGDAGCSWQKIQAYDFSSKNVYNAATDNHCSDEVANQAVTVINNAMVKQITHLNSIIIKNGSVAEDQINISSNYGDIRYIAK